MKTATLEINLSALQDNYRLLKKHFSGPSVAAVVKANAYGLGVESVSQALAQAGCRMFFVATLEEAIELRGALPEVSIAVFGGLHHGEERDYQHHQLIPVINSLAQFDRFLAEVPQMGDEWLGILHIDTGMTRLGLSFTELDAQPEAKLAFALSHLPLVMSHLACASEPQHPKNDEQLTRMRAAMVLLGGAQASLANSSGVFLDDAFHFQLARPGCALYGINPVQGANPMKHVATLYAPILQIRTTDRDETVGYGATHEMPKGARIAIVALGYADGYFRLLSNKGHAYIGGHKVPVIGHVSMDMLALDVSAVPESLLTPDIRAEFINAQQTVDDIARECGTIGYEIFTRIGRRVKREYKS